MAKLLSAMGRAFLRAFVAAIVTYGIGILAAPNLNRTYLLGVAAIVSAIVAALRALQAYFPKLSLASALGHPYGDWGDSFLTAFVAALIVTLPGILGAPDLSTARSLADAAVLGALTAGARAVQGLLTTGESPAPALGIADPPNHYSYAIGPAPAAGPPSPPA